MSFHWMMCLARDIEKLAGKDVYHKYGQEIIDCLKNMCSEHWEIVRYPEDEEILQVINEITQKE